MKLGQKETILQVASSFKRVIILVSKSKLSIITVKLPTFKILIKLTNFSFLRAFVSFVVKFGCGDFEFFERVNSTSALFLIFNNPFSHEVIVSDFEILLGAIAKFKPFFKAIFILS